MAPRFVALLACLCAAACGPYPRDIDGTYDDIVERGEVRVGLGELAGHQKAIAERYAQRVAKAAGVSLALEPEEHSNEALIGELDGGELDLVVAEVATDSPWVSEVSVIEPLAIRRSGARAIGLSPLAKNGENRWIGLLEREARELKAMP